MCDKLSYIIVEVNEFLNGVVPLLAVFIGEALVTLLNW